MPGTTPPKFDFEAVFEVDDYLYFYRDMLPDETSVRQVSFLVEHLAIDPEMAILDLACGFGRHANRLSALGFQVTGVDAFPGFLELAREEATRLGITVRYLQGDMRALPFERAFDRALLLFTAFGYFEDETNQQVLASIWRSLKPGGKLGFDIPNRDNVSRHYLPYRVTEKNGALMIDRHLFNPLEGRLYNRRIVIRDGVRRDKPFFIRMYNATEIRYLLEASGFVVERIFGGWDGEPLDTDSRRMVIIATKTGGPNGRRSLPAASDRPASESETCDERSA